MVKILSESTSIATCGNSSNLVGVPTGLLASTSFNDFPMPLCIHGIRENHVALFHALKEIKAFSEARQLFQEYMSTRFALKRKPSGTRRFYANYLHVLKGWGFDSNGQAGAVLKGWVESRFGLFPTFHKEPIQRFNSPAWITYMEEKMSSRFNNNDIMEQLDLLYEFCQWAMLCFFATGKKHTRLYRGTNNVKEMVQDPKSAVVRMNNLSSFTRERGIADAFGDTIIETDVPIVKLLCFNEILVPHTLQGESEYLVIGGDYRVNASYY